MATAVVAGAFGGRDWLRFGAAGQLVAFGGGGVWPGVCEKKKIFICLETFRVNWLSGWKPSGNFCRLTLTIQTQKTIRF